jgi:hypothetical protein
MGKGDTRKDIAFRQEIALHKIHFIIFLVSVLLNTCCANGLLILQRPICSPPRTYHLVDYSMKILPCIYENLVDD